MKFHWWFVPVAVVVLLLAVIVIFLLMLHRLLPWRNMLGMLSNMHMRLPAAVRRIAIGGRRDYSTLPEILIKEDGSSVRSPEQFEERKTEILQLFRENVYGSMPEDGFDISFEIVEEGPAMGGAAMRRQVRITVSTEKGSSDALMLVYLPISKERVPVVIGLNSDGNHRICGDPAILPSLTWKETPEVVEGNRGGRSYRWCAEKLISRGYGLATVYLEDFVPDSKDTFRDRVIGLFDEPQFRAIGAWAFGLRRGVDYLVSLPEVDAARVVAVGHSRLGKAAVWAAANDPRIAMVISNDSGNSGASLSRGNHGETVKSVNAFFTYWFCDRYASYGSRVNDLPVDQHELLACIAPGKVYVANGFDDLWSDPDGAWNSLMYAGKAFELYGLETIAGEPSLCGSAHQEENLRLFSESMGWHIRSGGHEMLEADWNNYLDYMDLYLR